MVGGEPGLCIMAPFLTSWRWAAALGLLLVVGAPLLLPLAELAAHGSGVWTATDWHRLGHLFQQTFLLVAGTWALALPVGIVLAIALFRTDFPARRFLLSSPSSSFSWTSPGRSVRRSAPLRSSDRPPVGPSAKPGAAEPRSATTTTLSKTATHAVLARALGRGAKTPGPVCTRPSSRLSAHQGAKLEPCWQRSL